MKANMHSDLFCFVVKEGKTKKTLHNQFTTGSTRLYRISQRQVKELWETNPGKSKVCERPRKIKKDDLAEIFRKKEKTWHEAVEKQKKNLDKKWK